MAAVIHPALHPTRPPQSRPGLRLVEGGRSPRHLAAKYRRRRIVVTILAVAVMGLVVLGAGPALGALRPDVPGAHGARPSIIRAGPPGEGAFVTVRPGDTLWSIARRLSPGGDIRAAVDGLAAIHGTGPLQVGERLPVSAAGGR